MFFNFIRIRGYNVERDRDGVWERKKLSKVFCIIMWKGNFVEDRVREFCKGRDWESDFVFEG